MSGIKKWWDNLSTASKFVAILAMLLLASNIIAIVFVNVKSNQIDNTVNKGFLKKYWDIFVAFGMENLLIAFSNTIKAALFIVINIVAYYFTYWIGKMLGAIKSLVELVSDITNDGWISVMLSIYTLIGISFDILTIMSFMSLI